jgi:glyoxylase-like metal-dependent hydrolase (beta-lactamase superfamily II)
VRLELRHSGIWQLASAVLSRDGAVVVIDPGYFPRELDELSQLARQHGEVLAVAFTHGHWDHVLGWRSFPGAAVWTSPRLAAAMRDGTAERHLRDARDFDGRWYVERGAPYAWPPPERVRPVGEGDELQVGGFVLRALTLPGHSADGLGLHVPGAGLLVVGDYLSPCEIPFVEDLGAYRGTLRRLLTLLSEVQAVVPGHGPLLTAARARALAEEDLLYLDALARCAELGDAAAARGLVLPRAAEVPGMAEHHLDNLRAAGLAHKSG